MLLAFPQVDLTAGANPSRGFSVSQLHVLGPAGEAQPLVFPGEGNGFFYVRVADSDSFCGMEEAHGIPQARQAR